MMMNRNLTIQLLLCALGLALQAGLLRAQETTAPVIRRPAVAGAFYPAGKEALESNLEALFERATPKELKGRVRCLIVPHAGYSYSGEVAASGYKSIPRDAEYSNIFIIAPSHREYFEGASVYSIGNYMTPLGEVPVNRTIAGELIRNNRFIRFNPLAHDREHSIEVQLPFMQFYFDRLPPIVPVVIGSSSVSTARELATALLPYFTPENLFVISTDFSHYPEYQDAVRLDRLTADGILTNDPKQFYAALQKNISSGVENLATPCCGWSSVLTLLYMSELDKSLHFTPVVYRNSGDTPIGERDRVVGYWAIAGHEDTPDQQQFLLNEQDKQTLLGLSRETLETYLNTRKVPEVVPSVLPGVLRQTAGAFVSLYKHGELRGCIGSFFPEEPLYRVVQEMTVASATRDTRFYPVDPGELGDISIEISVLTPLRKISSIDEFQMGRHGIYMIKDGRSGTYLPQVADQTGWNKEEFLGHCARDKAHIGWEGWKDADLFVYEAIVFGEEHGP
jgi:AmmeMemoRadiSam system protein B/AmmeMemoRadiSam system protein A